MVSLSFPPSSGTSYIFTLKSTPGSARRPLKPRASTMVRAAGKFAYGGVQPLLVKLIVHKTRQDAGFSDLRTVVTSILPQKHIDDVLYPPRSRQSSVACTPRARRPSFSTRCGALLSLHTRVSTRYSHSIPPKVGIRRWTGHRAARRTSTRSSRQSLRQPPC